MMTFDRVLPELLRICSEHLNSRTCSRCGVVRDVRGRVRLVIRPREGGPGELEGLSAKLEAALGRYFVGPVLSTRGSPEQKRVADGLLDLSKSWPLGWPVDVLDVLGGTPQPIDQELWRGVDRTVGKEAWMRVATPTPPWPLLPGKTSPIMTFHSFKGGVGRSTLVAAYAVHLSRRDPPPRVAIIDLDLEAPGIGALLNVRTRRGVLDVLIDHLATERIDLEDASQSAPMSGLERLTVFPAGSVDDSYLQKLARLDYSSSEPGAENPVGTALYEMLRVIRDQYDVVLLDSRAGLHDLAGMSLHGLAHVDVLVFRGTTQHFDGLEQTLRVVGARQSPELVLVETMLPTDREVAEARHRRSREHVYDLLVEHVYPEEDPPQAVDVGMPHDVVPIFRKDWLDALDSIEDCVQQILSDQDFQQLTSRIDQACRLGTSPDGDDEEGTA